MYTLNPSETYGVTWQNPDPIDIATAYYPQAKVYDVVTGDLLATVNLALITNGLYSGNLKVPADPSGLGRWITITTIIYSDALHTTKATNQGIINSNFLVQLRPSATFGMGGGGVGWDVTPKKFLSGIEDLIQKHKQKINFPKFPDQEKIPDIKSMIEDSQQELLDSIGDYVGQLMKQVATGMTGHKESMLAEMKAHSERAGGMFAEHGKTIAQHKEEMGSAMAESHSALEQTINQKMAVWDKEYKNMLFAFKQELLKIINEKIDDIDYVVYQGNRKNTGNHAPMFDEVESMARRLAQ